MSCRYAEPDLDEMFNRTYDRTLDALESLPERIADERRAVAGLSEALASAKEEMETARRGVIAEQNGWKAMGANDTEREHRLADLLAVDVGYSLLRGEYESIQREKTAADIALKQAEDSLSAAKAVAYMTAGMMNYLAGRGGRG